MASRPFQSSDMPGVLALPVVRWQEETADQRCLVAGHSGNRLALADDAEAAHPVSVEASAGERPAPVDPPAALGLLRRPGGLGYTGNQHVRAVAVGLIVGLARQQGSEKLAAIADHRGPADRTVNPRERSDDPERRRQIELHPAMAARHKQAKDAD